MLRSLSLLAVAAAGLIASAVPAEAAWGKGFTGAKVVSAFFPSYQMSPADVPYSKYTHLDYFVFTTTPSASAISQAGIDDSLIRDFVARAHAAGITVSYTVGGWTGSQYFSTHVATAQGRTTFARTLVAVMQQYGFDGIDIDWEYPGVQGQGDNIVSAADSANYLLFLQTLRNIAGIDTRLSIDVPVGNIVGANGAPLTDMTGFAAVLDYVTLMSYDVTGTWNGYTGSNSPLTAGCSPAGNPFSIASGMGMLTRAGFSGAHILVGLPNYAYAYYVRTPLKVTTCPDGTTTTLYQYGTSGSTCGTYIGNNGQYLYKDLVNKNYWKPTSGFRKFKENYSQSWSLWNPVSGEFIATDAPGTIWAKARLVFRNRVGGVNFFDASGDTASGVMVQAARWGLGLDGVAPLTSYSY